MEEGLLLVILTLDATIRVSVPLILCALAGLVVERSGVIDIGLEGKMLAAAFAAATVAALTSSAWIGLMAGIGSSILLALLHGFACITHRGNQIVSGVAINILASGLTVLLGISWFQLGGQTPPLTGNSRFSALTFPGAETVANSPLLGQLYSELFSGHNVLVYVTFMMVPLVWWLVYRTRFGLRLRATGENPAAVDAAGINVIRMRYLALIICGILCGIAGAYLSTGHGAGFLREMTAGKGFIALAAMIFGKWRPVPVLFACLLFGFLDALAIRMQGVELFLIGEMSVQFIQAMPYILTVVLLAGFIGRAIAPKASGIPYVKEH